VKTGTKHGALPSPLKTLKLKKLPCFIDKQQVELNRLFDKGTCNKAKNRRKYTKTLLKTNAL
jgi:hypothetical protein